MNRFEWQLAWRYLGGQRKSFFVTLISLFSLMGVAIGTWALVVVLSAINGFEKEVTSQMMGKDAHFELMQYHHKAFGSYDSITRQVELDSEVIGAAPFIISKVGISSKRANDGIVVYGIDADQSKKVVDLSNKITAGVYGLDSLLDTDGRKKPSMMLGSVLANRLAVKIGDKLILQTFQSPDGMGATTPKLVQYKLGGIFETGMYEYDANLAYVSIPTAQRLLGLGPKVHGIQAIVKDPWQAETVALRIKGLFGYPFYTLDWKAKNQTLLKWMRLEKKLFGGAICLIILVAAFNIISSLIMVVIEKTREIGILRAMGVSSQSIMRIFVMVGGFVGFFGTLFGTVFGVLICLAQQEWGFIKLPPDVYMISVFPVEVLWSDIIMVFVVGNILTLGVTILPARKAAKHNPLEAIRHE